MMLPTIHLNGTSRGNLREQVRRAHEAANDLMQALKEMTPNGRDYYPQGEEAIHVAVIEHGERIAKLGSIMYDLEALAEHTYEGEP